MPTLELKPTHKAVVAYCDALAKFDKLGVKHEGAVSSAFEDLLVHCARLVDRVLVPKHAFKRRCIIPRSSSTVPDRLGSTFQMRSHKRKTASFVFRTSACVLRFRVS